MDIKDSLYTRTERYIKHEYSGNNKYDYGKYGILRLCLPKIFFKGNAVFVTFLQMIDMEFIMLFKFVEKIKHFKHLTWYI